MFRYKGYGFIWLECGCDYYGWKIYGLCDEGEYYVVSIWSKWLFWFGLVGLKLMNCCMSEKGLV